MILLIIIGRLLISTISLILLKRRYEKPKGILTLKMDGEAYVFYGFMCLLFPPGTLLIGLLFNLGILIDKYLNK